jgi:hypothetical protein
MSTTGRTMLIVSVSVIAVAGLILIGIMIGVSIRGPWFGWMQNSPFMMARNLSYSGWMGSGQGMMGMMFGDYSVPNRDPTSQDGLEMDLVEDRLTEFLSGRDGLEVGEIMIFDNHAYAEIVERDTGIGAMEVLVDPVSLQIAPEHGPNMMWNLKYGSMHGRGMMDRSEWAGDLEMPINPEKAVELAQAFMDRYEPGLSVDEHADVFYGYYTLHTEHDGEVIGMLSVNGYTGQVFPHTWHGELLSMSEADDH